MESVFYESGKVRIEVERAAEDVFMWFAGPARMRRDADGAVYEYNGIHDSLEECLGEAAGEMLEGPEAAFTISRDQRTAVRT